MADGKEVKRWIDPGCRIPFGFQMVRLSSVLHRLPAVAGRAGSNDTLLVNYSSLNLKKDLNRSLTTALATRAKPIRNSFIFRTYKTVSKTKDFKFIVCNT